MEPGNGDMSARCGIPAVIATGAALLSGCITAPLVPPVPAAPAAPVAAAAATPIVVAPVAPAAPCTLPGFLGITPLCAAAGKDVQHKLAFFGQYFPFLEPKPPLLTLTDPANLTSPVPAIAAAAEIKAEQDLAPQKIKALKYLATIGCGGCYAGVEEAFLAALEDCTEEVRFEAVKAIYATTGNPCVHCNEKSCCSPRLRKKLAEMAFEGMPCPSEPSARVRRMARVALTACGAPAPVEVPPAGPIEVIPPAPTEIAPPPGAAPPPPPPEPYASTISTEALGAAATILPVPRPAISSVSTTSRSSMEATASNIVPPFNTKLDVATALASNDDTTAPQPSTTDAANSESAAPLVATEKSATDAAPSDDVDDDELQEYFAAHRERYHRAEQVRWESVSVAIEDFESRETAMEVMQHVRRLASGETPSAPAAFDPKRITAHRHGWTPQSEIASPPVAAALFSESATPVSDVMTDGQRLILVRVLERRPAGDPAFAEVADRVRADLLTEQAAAVFVSVEQSPPAAPVADAPSEPTAPAMNDLAPPEAQPTETTVPETAEPTLDAVSAERPDSISSTASAPMSDNAVAFDTWMPDVTMKDLVLGPTTVPDVIRLSHESFTDDQSAAAPTAFP